VKDVGRIGAGATPVPTPYADGFHPEERCYEGSRDQ